MFQSALRRRHSLAPGLMAIAAALALVGTAVAPAGAAQQEHSRKLLIRYEAKSDCTVVPNYPGDGVRGNKARTWTIKQGKTVIWRYNVDSEWALVSDPSRAHERFPWWGFTRRACIGASVKQKDYPADVAVPNRILEGRSQKESGWRTVHFDVSAGQVVDAQRRVRSNGTLRDPANFVVGNVFKGWRVQVTAVTRGNGHWVLVYVPNAKRWGYVERGHLG